MRTLLKNSVKAFHDTPSVGFIEVILLIVALSIVIMPFV